jgi:hypothetical protein
MIILQFTVQKYVFLPFQSIQLKCKHNWYVRVQYPESNYCKEALLGLQIYHLASLSAFLDTVTS